ncbi:MAG: peptidoglycan-associated lipoprotein Pal [Gammaproteobacteria bacterium]|nr:MAG: peptidoglycan-associated lipoprotein Pal [Gammaproteobacteria bacterium]
MKRKIIYALMMAGTLMGCDPAQVRDDAAAEDMAGTEQPGDSVQLGGLGGELGPDGRPLGAEQVVSYEKNAIYDANSVLAERVIYFDFDSDQISQDYMDLIAHHGKYLAKNPDMRLRLEGHADERGTREYNIALGNRRAQTVQRLISFQGVGPNQVTVISYGEEKPVALGHDEEAWRLNRRAELIYETN